MWTHHCGWNGKFKILFSCRGTLCRALILYFFCVGQAFDSVLVFLIVTQQQRLGVEYHFSIGKLGRFQLLITNAAAEELASN